MLPRLLCRVLAANEKVTMFKTRFFFFFTPKISHLFNFSLLAIHKKKSMSNQTAFQRYLVKMHSDNYLNRFSSVFFSKDQWNRNSFLFHKTFIALINSFRLRFQNDFTIALVDEQTTAPQIYWPVSIFNIWTIPFAVRMTRRDATRNEWKKMKWRMKWNENEQQQQWSARKRTTKMIEMQSFVTAIKSTHTHMAMHLVNATCMVSFVSWFLFSIRFSG